MTPEIAALIAALDTADHRAQQEAGDKLREIGRPAIPALVEAMRSPSPDVRKAAAFLLGRARAAPDIVTALANALRDAEPKVRKNVAVALGTLADPATVETLAQAAEREQVGWVRASLILALGAVGGAAAHTALQSIQPRDEREREAHRKALDRAAPRQQRATWRDAAAWHLPLLMDAPQGLEHIAVEEATARDVDGCRVIGPGLIRCPAGIAPWQVIPALRCVYGVLIDGGTAAPLPIAEPDAAISATRNILRASAALQGIGEWLDSAGAPIRYRFAVKGTAVPRPMQRLLLQAARDACAPLGLSDSPSNYDLELTLLNEARGARLVIRPSFMPDERFAYRHKDVGASINPVVAAGLARLVRTSERASVFDPTCGSGTLLIERAHLDAQTRLRGTDISSTAVGAALTNVRAARLERRVEIANGDAVDPQLWQPCDELMANLPWGARTRQHAADLPRLYGAVVDNLARALRSGGRAVLYSANAQALETALARHKRALTVEERWRIFSGGVWSTALVLRRH